MAINTIDKNLKFRDLTVLRQKDTFFINESLIKYLGVRYEGIVEYAILERDNKRIEIKFNPLFHYYEYPSDEYKIVIRDRVLGWSICKNLKSSSMGKSSTN